MANNNIGMKIKKKKKKERVIWTDKDKEFAGILKGIGGSFLFALERDNGR